MIQRGSSKVFIDLQSCSSSYLKFPVIYIILDFLKDFLKVCYVLSSMVWVLNYFLPWSRPPLSKNKLHCFFIHTALLSLHVNVTFIFQELYLIWNINWIDNSRDNVYMILDIPIRKQVILIYEVSISKPTILHLKKVQCDQRGCMAIKHFILSWVTW